MKTISRYLNGLGALLALAGALTWGSAPRLAAAEATNPAPHTATAAAAPAGAGHEAAPAGAAHGAVHAEHGHSHAGGSPDFLTQFGYSYLTAYMFCLSLCMGSLFLVFVHHLFDAGWSVSIRRVCEQLSSLLFPHMLIAVIPILLLQKKIYPWLSIDPATDHSLDTKKALFNVYAFNFLVFAFIASWGYIAHLFRKWSLAQDKDGAVKWTQNARKLAAGGMFWFAISLTLVCFYLMKSIQHQFFSTMYGVYYFAGSVWLTLVTLWVLVLTLRDRGPLKPVIFKRQIQDLGVWFFAFTVFYAYIHFSQYFLIWNAAMPEETFWYVQREQGSWKWVGFTILFGHFIVPFLVLLNQDIKLNKAVMIPMAAWAWLMHYVDMTFNIKPPIAPEGLNVTIWDPLCWFGLAAVLGFGFWKRFHAAPAWPLRDPRLKEAVTHHVVPGPGEAAAHH
jgi:hypothetical protein